MAGKLSPRAQGQLNTLRELSDRVQRLHGLVEQYATTKSNPDHFLMPIGRMFGQLRLLFAGANLDSMSQVAGSMEIAAKRGMSQISKARILREGIGSMRFQLELEQRSVVSEDLAQQARQAGGEDASDGP